MSDQNKR